MPQLGPLNKSSGWNSVSLRVGRRYETGPEGPNALKYFRMSASNVAPNLMAVLRARGCHAGPMAAVERGGLGIQAA